jgi:16S rRNA (guanine1516-N2)-methyltransferase
MFATTKSPDWQSRIDEVQAGLAGFGDFDFELSDSQLVLIERLGKSRIRYQIDIESFLSQIKSYPVAKDGALNRALGKQSKVIVDATAGWGGDLLRLWSQGYQLIGLEQTPLLVLFLDYAITQLDADPRLVSQKLVLPKLIQGNAINLLGDSENCANADAIYLDPMFPEKRKKSAASNKNMQLLKRLLVDQANDNNENLVQAALDTGCKRIVVKRPHYADPLVREPNERFSSKLIHFDVYLNH